MLAHFSLAQEQSGLRLRELLIHFRTIADRSPLPVILFSDSGRALHANNIIELAAHPNTLGLLTQDVSIAMTEILARTESVKRVVTVTPSFAAVTTRMKKATLHAAAPLISASILTGESSTAVAEPPSLPVLRTRTKTVGFQILTSSAQAIFDSLSAPGAVECRTCHSLQPRRKHVTKFSQLGKMAMSQSQRRNKTAFVRPPT